MQPFRPTFPAAALAAAMAIPFLITRHTPPLGAFYGDWAAALLGCLLIGVLACWQRHPGEDCKLNVVPWITLVPAWLIATSAAQSIYAMPDITGARVTTQLVLAFGAVMITVAWRFGQLLSVERRGHIVDAMAIALVIAGLLGALTQWVQVFGLEKQFGGLVSAYYETVGRRPWGNLNQANHQAAVEGLALAATVWLAARGKLPWVGWLIAVAVIESGLVISASRISVIFVGLAALYALITAVLSRTEPSGRNSQQRPVAMVGAAAVTIMVFVALLFGIGSANQAFGWNLIDTVSRIESGNQMASRGPLWQHAIAMFRAHPWLGVGYGEFGWAQFEQVADVGVQAAMTLHAHNALLDMLAKTGVVGTLGVMLGMLAWGWRVVRVRLLSGGPEEQMQTAIVLAWLAVIGTHAMLEYPLHYLYFFLPVCFMLGWLDTAGVGNSQRFPVKFAIAGFLALAAITLVTMWQDYGRLEARERARPERLRALPMPTFWFGAYAHAQLVQSIVITPENAAKLVQFQLEAVHLSPAPVNIRRMAWLYALTGNPEKGKLWLGRLRYYGQGDESRQFARINADCGELDLAIRPREFCSWAEARSASIGD